MARAQENGGLEPSSLANPGSPSMFLKKGKVDRHFVCIPRDQTKLIDSPDAWSDNLRKRPQGLCNLPAEVLSHLKESALEKVVGQQGPSQAPSVPATPTPFSSQQGNVIPQTGTQETESLPNGSAPPAGQRAPESSDNEDGRSCISWSASPEQPAKRTLATLMQPPSSLSPGQRKPSSVTPILVKRTFTDDFPSSSAGSDGELELQVPAALDQTMSPVSPVPLPQPTPPSAQVIPCTYSNSSSPAKSERQRKRQRLMKHPRDVFAAQDEQYAALRKEAEMKKLERHVRRPSNLPSLSIETLLAELHRDQEARSATGAVWTDPSQDASEASPRRARTDVAKEGRHITDKAPSRLGSPAMRQSPYEEYTKAYPEYSGSIGDFVRACWYIRGLQHKGSLASFLYDDVIRAFFEDYIPYITSSAGAPVPLLEWYNRNTHSLRYGKGVVTSQNVEAVLDAFPETVQEIELQIAGPQASDRIPQSAEDGVEQQGEQETSPLELNGGTQAGSGTVHTAVVTSVTVVEDVMQTTELPDTSDPEQVQVPATVPASSPPPPHDATIESGSQQEVAVSTDPPSEVVQGETPLEQQPSSPDLAQEASGIPSLLTQIPPATFERPRQSTPLSVSSTSTSRRRQRNETPEKRSIRWKKFLIRRFQNSAPSSAESSFA